VLYAPIPGRREIGHGALAERSLLAVLPNIEQSRRAGVSPAAGVD
jgi:polyribonucleotide nucleotidyltransferase